MATRCSPLFVWLSRATFKHKTCRLSTLSLISFRFQVSNILTGEKRMESSVAGYGTSYTDARCADARRPLFLTRPLDSCSCIVILREILPLRDILLCFKSLPHWNWRRHFAGSIHPAAHSDVALFRGASIA
jgi:hypothetical protein